MLTSYRNSLLILLLGLNWGMPGRLAAQNTPDLSQTAPAGSANTISLPQPITVPGGKLNYEREFVPRLPVTNAGAVNNSAANVQVKTTYIDGFRRDMQVVAKDFVQGRHLVLPIDTRFQKDQWSFLPYSTTNSSSFDPYAFTQQHSFYLSYYPGEGTTSYSLMREYSDAMDKMTQTYAAGKSQVGQSRGRTARQVTNAAGEVPVWSVDASGLPLTSGYYPAGALFGEKVSSAEGAESLIYKDKDGRVIYEKKYLEDAVAGGGGVVAIYGITQYVYDEMGSLRFTIPPKAASLVSGGTLSQAVLDNLCFQYRYDNRGLKVEQKLPGKEAEYFVYDNKKRLVLYQDGNLREDFNWKFTAYDALDRPLFSGLYFTSNESRTVLQDFFYDNINYPSIYLIHYLKNYAMFNSYPTSPIVNTTILQEIYYDDYSHSDPSGTVWNTFSSELQFTEVLNLPGSETPQRSNRTEGKVTGTKIKIILSPNANPSKTGDWIENTYYYDDKGRPVYAVSRTLYQGSPLYIHYSGNQYNFSNQLMLNKHVVVNTLAEDGIYRHSELHRNVFDGTTGRLSQTRHKVDNGPFNVTSLYNYDELGRPKRKVLGNYGEVQDFDYNIRGQLTGINSLYAETGDRQGESRSFGASLKYDYGFTQPRYDGKLSGIVWRGAGNAQAMAYGYKYDKSGRLTTADYRRYEPPGPGYLSWAWRSDLSDYSVSNLHYDRNGNLESMTQRGLNLTGQPDFIDKLKYTYASQSNQLVSVFDTITADYGRGDFQDGYTGSTDYQYDPNGNIKEDKNKNIADVSYTYLNKPQRIQHGTEGYVEYSYDATGNKIQELNHNAAAGTTAIFDYLGNFVYKNTGLQYLQTIDGRTVYNAASQSFKEEYYVKDHLGNVRSVIDVYTYPTQEYLATYEVASANLENLFFEKIDEVRDDKPGSTWNGDLKSARLNGADPARTTGTSALLKVMAGDKVDMTVNNFYENYSQDIDDSPLNPEDLLASIITTLTGGTGGMPGEAHDTKLVDRAFTSDNYSIFNSIVQGNTDPSRPKAYLNYILFDENMRIVEGSSGSFQANGNGTWTQIGTTTPLVMPQNGYLAVFLNNGSGSSTCLTCTDVFFDQLVLRFTRGSLKEEAHYYPHGLPIAGIGSAAQGFVENRKKYQANSFTQDFKLNWMDFYARQYDPQVGKFLSIDPLADGGGQQIFSPYAAMGNNPAMMVDPFGTIFKVSGDMGMARQMLNNWFGANNYDLIGDMVTIVEGKESEAFKNLTAYFMKFGIGGSAGAAAASAKWVMDMIKDPNRTVTAAVQNNGRITLDAVNESGEFKKGFTAAEVALYSDIESGVSQLQNRSYWTKIVNDIYGQGTFIASTGASFITSTNFGRGLAMGGIEFRASAYSAQKVMINNAKWSSSFLKTGGNVLGGIGIGITLYDMRKNGINAGNSLDLIMGGVSFIPGVGWIIGGVYFVGNAITIGATGQSIGDHAGNYGAAVSQTFESMGDGIIETFTTEKDRGY